MSAWSTSDIPSQAGKLAVITGATGGLGYETALALAGAGAEVVVTGRNPRKGAEALAKIHARHPAANVSFELVDLASLAKVSAFAESFAARHSRIDILVNNAGVMALPTRQVSADGFELQFATNYLGHFALTAHLLPLLQHGARVVSLSSIAARSGVINLDDLQTTRSYKPWTAYGQSKLACLMFALELQRRSDAAGWGLTSLAAHPGISRTDLIGNGMGTQSPAAIVSSFTSFVFQSAAQGALPTLFAATAPAAKAGGYYGPRGLMELRGAPTTATFPPRALDKSVAKSLWDASENLASLRFAALAAAA